MTDELVVSLDANCFNYFTQAWYKDPSEPLDVLAEQKVALLRTYLYSPIMSCFWITETAKSESLAPLHKKAEREGFLVLVADLVTEDPGPIDDRVSQLLQRARAEKRHARRADSTILAECEQSVADVLLTYDKKFNGFLRERANGVRVLRPLEHWEELGIPRGAAVNRGPAPSNPLYSQKWWRWE